MGTVFNRGTKDNPKWYVGYRENGRWVYKASRQPTKTLAKRWVSEIESRIARGQVGIEDDDDAPQFKASFESFLEGLQNRNAADDRSRGRRHLLPHFARKKVADIDLSAVMEWIDKQRAAGELGEASIRHNMNMLSRFFSWAIARGKASINPVRLIPMGSRPTQSVKSDTPWLDDDAIVRKLINVSAAVGHSSPIVTKRFYDHYVRRSFSPKLRAGLGLGAKRVGDIVPIRKAARSVGR